MFNSQKKQYNVFTFTSVKNDYNEEIKTPILYKTIDIFISLLQHNQYTANNVNLMNCTYLGLTTDRTLLKSMVIENRYIIEFINDYGNETILYLKEVSE